MKDWAFTTTIEEMEAATNSLLETAHVLVGADKVDLIIELYQSLSSLCRNKDDLRVRQE